MSTNRPDLEHVASSKRAQIESWWAHCHDQRLDEMQYAFFLDEESTREELTAFLSPLAHADDLTDLLDATMKLWVRDTTRQHQSESVLLAALKDCMDEMVHNAKVVGADQIANTLGAVTTLRLVDEIDTRTQSEWVHADLMMEMFDAVRRDLRSSGDIAARNLYRVASEWFPFSLMSVHVVRPLLGIDLRVSAFYRLWCLGAECAVTTDTALVARL